MTSIIFKQKLNLLCLIFVLLCTCGNAQSGCGYGGWVPYNEDKCILILDKFLNAEEATEICTSKSPSESSHLVSIKTKEEQLFLKEHLYEVSGVVDNVWLAARRNNDSTFIWSEDNTPVRYANWAPGSPSSGTEKGCVQMISRHSKEENTFTDGNGHWEDVSCLRRNLVVCQKLKTLPPIELEKIVLDLRRRVDENEKIVEENRKMVEENENKVEENEKKVEENENKVEENQKMVIEMKNMVEEYEIEIEDLKNNPVPVGFIYVQLSGQPEPNEIWTKVQFTDVTSTYAGQFFRALGGDSSGFGTTQSFSSPTLWIERENILMGVSPLTVPIGSWSNDMLTGTNAPASSGIGVRFKFETNEVRPYNSAVKIWKRTT